MPPIWSHESGPDELDCGDCVRCMPQGTPATNSDSEAGHLPASSMTPPVLQVSSLIGEGDTIISVVEVWLRHATKSAMCSMPTMMYFDHPNLSSI